MTKKVIVSLSPEEASKFAQWQKSQYKEPETKFSAPSSSEVRVFERTPPEIVGRFVSPSQVHLATPKYPELQKTIDEFTSSLQGLDIPEDKKRVLIKTFVENITKKLPQNNVEGVFAKKVPVNVTGGFINFIEALGTTELSSSTGQAKVEALSRAFLSEFTRNYIQ